MSLSYFHFEQLESTNVYLQRKQSEYDIRNWVVSADEQTAGKGMGNNGWESETGQNLTFSLALDMSFLAAERQFLLSEAVPLGIIEVLDKTLLKDFENIDSNCTTSSRNDMASKLSIKWPNDIFYENRKLAGILINSTIKGKMMDVSIIGIGLNINQLKFQKWPTKPISLKLITGENYDLEPLLKLLTESIVHQIERLKNDSSGIEQDYLKRLFRYHTWSDYEIDGKTTRLFMKGIDRFGRLQLLDEQQTMYTFNIKEIKFVI